MARLIPKGKPMSSLSSLSLPSRTLSRRSLFRLLGATAAGAAGATLLSACGGAAGAEDYAQPDGEVPAEYRDRQRIVFWSAFTGNNGDAVAKLVDRFNESQTDIFAEVQVFDGYDGVDTKLVASLQARETPDLVILSDVHWNRYFLNESLEPLDDYFGGDFTPDVYQPAFIEEGQVGGSTWWVPLARSTPLFYYNREIFEMAGLPDRAPETWTEMREWGQELKGLEYRNLEVKLRPAISSDDWYFSGQLWAFGGGISDGLDVILDSEASLAAAQYEHDLMHTDQTTFYSTQGTEDFLAGLSATHLQSTGGLTNVKKNADFDFACGFLPQEVGYGVPTGGSGLAIPRFSTPERKEAAFELIRFLAQEQQSAEWSADTGYMPATLAAAESDVITKLRQEDPNYGIAVDQLERAQAPDHVRRYVSSAINDIRTGLERTYTETTPVETVWGEVADKLRADIDAIRPQYEKLVEA